MKRSNPQASLFDLGSPANYGALSATCWSGNSAQLCLCYEEGFVVLDSMNGRPVKSFKFEDWYQNKHPVWHEKLGFVLLLNKANFFKLYSIRANAVLWQLHFTSFKLSQALWTPGGNHVAMVDSHAELIILNVREESVELVLQKNFSESSDDDLDETEINLDQWSRNGNNLVMRVGSLLQKQIYIVDAMG